MWSSSYTIPVGSSSSFCTTFSTLVTDEVDGAYFPCPVLACPVLSCSKTVFALLPSAFFGEQSAAAGESVRKKKGGGGELGAELNWGGGVILVQTLEIKQEYVFCSFLFLFDGWTDY